MGSTEIRSAIPLGAGRPDRSTSSGSRTGRVLAGLAPLALVLASCGSGGSSVSSTVAPTGRGAGPIHATTHHTGADVVNIAIADDPSGLDPQAFEDGNALAIYDNISEPLLSRTAADNKVGPLLALSWNQTNPSTWEFKLRSGVTFSDGVPFNADAVVASIKRITNPKFATEQSDWVGDINGASKVDDLTVDITTSAPDPTVPKRMSLIMMVPPSALTNPDFPNHPIGTGPYTLVSSQKGGKTILQANPTYWGGKPAIAEAIFQPVSEPTVRLAGIKTGELNLVTGLLPEQLSQVPVAVHAAGLEFPTVILDTRGGPFADKNLRLAANYAIDNVAILNKLYSGFGHLANCQLMGPAAFGYNPTLQNYPYDPAKAKQLVKDAHAPTLNVLFAGDASNRWLKDVELEQAITGYLTAVGFTVKTSFTDFATYLGVIFPPKNNATIARPDMIFVSHDNVFGDADVTASTYFETTGGGASTSNTALDTQIDAARHELDVSKRQQMYQDINKSVCDDADFIFMSNLDNTWGMTSDLNWTPRYDAEILVNTMSWG
ncbi:MAG TPA: ABC transporter substrate-binding protein [Candidatus Saccharimonadales bacterium]|nr:ABC transporter substrate-binding protein [Candidatus Saccharimonadales bacterium]